MEIHRLKPMEEGYDVKLFNELYKKTAPLRKSLVYQIDNRRLGVSREEVLSWFDDKFIFAFNKYWKKEPDRLLGYVINSLKMFKYRILRKAYQDSTHQNSISLDNEDIHINIIAEEGEESNLSLLTNLALEFMKVKLSDDAYFVLQLQLWPPEHILNSIPKTSSPISAQAILETLELPVNTPNITWIRQLKLEIQEATIAAKQHFSQVELALN